MTRLTTALLTGAAIAIAGCVQLPATAPSADLALEAYYNTISDSALPRAPDGPALPAADTVLTRILVGSCHDEELDDPAMTKIAGMEADLFLMIGDNVYGDRDGPRYAQNDPDLTELRESFSDLGRQPEFVAVRAAHPMMVAWDDHDYGFNDAGREFPFRRFAERIHENFWGLADEPDVGARDGTYYARSFGPDGQRVQIIMLDTRFFRSELTATDEWGAKGKERYMPSSDPDQDMLGTAQWTWLAEELQKPADIRLIVSSIQVLPQVHGYEAWATMPQERQKLFSQIKQSGAKGVVFVSGDRHTGFLYEDTSPLDYTAFELTSSSLNKSFNDTSDEYDARQIGDGVAIENIGDIQIDWSSRQLQLGLMNGTGDTVIEKVIGFDEIGL